MAQAQNTVVIDGKNLILGRLGAIVAKKILAGEQVVVLNAEYLAISGDKKYIEERYQKRRWAVNKANPEHSPHWPRRPDLLVKRVIRGMLPFDSSHGRKAFKNLRVYMGIPHEFENAQKADLGIKTTDALNTRYTLIGELCARLGYAVHERYRG